MAEFCLKCFNDLNKTDYKVNEVWLEEAFCEGCADRRPCVVGLRPKPIIRRLADWVHDLFRRLLSTSDVASISFQSGKHIK